ncbi:MAG: twin-arginine translocation signal domain-containing protein [Syntrophobacteraceae bacterium]|nr:twin-arginine translocation signal domain-containing protein [Syntrophobacteraceae bacterium]
MGVSSFVENQKQLKETVDRRTFMKKLGAAGAVAAASATSQVVSAPSVWAQGQTHSWRMATTWPRGLPIFHDGAERFAKLVEERSEGRLKIQVFAGGEMVPPFETFKAVSEGGVEVGHSVSFYWEDKIPAAPWFSAVPFGFNAQGINAWLYSGGGLKLWEEVYAPFNVVPRPVGNTGVQMGGWFKKKVEAVDDLKGLKMRMGGLGARVLTKAGVNTAIYIPGGEIYAALESGKVDAADWVGPVHDLQMGLYKVAKYYYFPGWHEPGSAIEVLFNKKAYDALPRDLRNILDAVAMENNLWTLCEFEAQNFRALQTLVNQLKVQVVRFPIPVMNLFRKLTEEVLAEEASKDPTVKKVNTAFQAFKKELDNWGYISERAYYDFMGAKPETLEPWVSQPVYDY